MKTIRLVSLCCALATIASACVPSPQLPSTGTPGLAPTQPEPTTTWPAASPPQMRTPEPIQLPIPQPDVIYHNANIFTMDPQQPNTSAIAIAGDLIVAVGSDEAVLGLAGSSTMAIDLHGLTIAPGFIDSHEHRMTQLDKCGYASMVEASQDALSMGWTGVVELAVDQHQLNELIAADEAGELGIRVNVYLTVDTFSGDRLGDWYQAYQPNQRFSPFLRIAGLKIFIDFDSGRTLLWDQDELNDFIRQRQAEGWQIAVKAIGIRSHELALTAFEHALNGEQNGDFRYRIEHSLAASGAQILRMANRGIIASIQPSFPGVIWHVEDIRNLTAEEGIENMFRWRDYMDAGVFMTASTLNPPEPMGSGPTDEFCGPSHFAPMGVIYRNVTQIGLAGALPETWMLDRALTVDELLPMLTIHGAYATFEEHEKGSLVPGKLADLVVLSADPRAAPPHEIPDIQVLMTMVGGQTAFCADGQDAICVRSEQDPLPGFSSAQGSWTATDIDASSMSMDLVRNADGSFTISATDEDAGYCRRQLNSDVAIGLEWEGRGGVDGYTLVLRGITGSCIGTGVTLVFDYDLIYDPTGDTLLDVNGVLWHRE